MTPGAALRDPTSRPAINRKAVSATFALILLMNLLINIDHGVMPAGAIAIRQSLGISNTEYGLLGSMVFFGLVMGSLAATFVFNNFSAKVVLCCALAFNALS